MRPSADQILESLAYTVRNDLAPEVSSPWGKRQVRAVLGTIEHLRQRALHERETTLAERTELLALLGRAHALRGSDGELAPALNALDWGPYETAAAAPADPSELEAETIRLRSVVDELIRTYPAEPAGAGNGLWDGVQTYLHNQIQRERLYTNLTF